MMSYCDRMVRVVVGYRDRVVGQRDRLVRRQHDAARLTARHDQLRGGGRRRGRDGRVSSSALVRERRGWVVGGGGARGARDRDRGLAQTDGGGQMVLAD